MKIKRVFPGELVKPVDIVEHRVIKRIAVANAFLYDRRFGPCGCQQRQSHRNGE